MSTSFPEFTITLADEICRGPAHDDTSRPRYRCKIFVDILGRRLTAANVSATNTTHTQPTILLQQFQQDIRSARDLQITLLALERSGLDVSRQDDHQAISTTPAEMLNPRVYSSS